MNDRLRDLSVGIIGAGRVGTALAALLSKKQVTVAFVVDSDQRKADRYASRCGAERAERSIARIDVQADVILIAVPDNAIETVVADMVAGYRLLDGSVVAHTSGLHTSDILAPLRPAGARVCSMHPAFSFPEEFEGGLAGVPFALEGDDVAVEICESIVESLGAKPIRIRKEDKARLHLGCTVASNYLVALAGAAKGLLKDVEGIESPDYFLPLLHATLKNIEDVGPVSALTGPVARGDVRTVEAHLDLLKNLGQEILEAYIAMGRLTLRLAMDAGLSVDKQEAMTALFRRFEDDCS